MPDMSDIVRALKARLSEIDEQLAEWRRLTDEREQLQVTLDFYEHHRGAMQPFPGIPLADKGSLAHLALVESRFKPRADSKTSKIVERVRAILERTPGNAAPFPSVLRQLPSDLVGNAEHAKEGVRTAIKRAGGRVGVTYEHGGTIRWKSPRAQSA